MKIRTLRARPVASLCLPALAEQAPRKVLYTGRLNTNVELLAEPRLDAEVVEAVEGQDVHEFDGPHQGEDAPHHREGAGQGGLLGLIDAHVSSVTDRPKDGR